ncbi:MAG TPA: AraC family transcriptional regulator [Patescibacteria group bacterium]|nr:AraC family transcriptional regulator [Patescibacteria group bacterium]
MATRPLPARSPRPSPAPPSARLLNPPEAVLGTRNAVLSGTSRRYFVPDYEGCLSLKSVLRGSAIWEAGGRRFVVHEGSHLLLNDGQRYTMTIDSAVPVTTFCLFFERGFVETAFRAEASPLDRLLGAGPGHPASGFGFQERIEPPDTPVASALARFARRVAHAGPEARSSDFDDVFFTIARLLVEQHHSARSCRERLPAARASTRRELFRRVLRGRDFLLSSLAGEASLQAAARAACLSPYHFHRSFLRAFGLTPHRFLTRYRLERARRLLATTDRTVTEICLECGFESPGSFSALFSRHFGQSPLAFRRRSLHD